MAKAKKKESTLTLEEKLVQALVPESEQPYKVPKNWCWTRLNFVGEYKKGPFGSAITKAMFVPKGYDTYKVYEQGNAIRKTIKYGEYYISEDKYKELKGFEVVPGDFIVSCAGTVGETYQIPIGAERGIINQALMRIRLSEIVCDDYFLNYFDDALRQDITGKAKGTAMKNIPQFAVLKKFPFPLPPFSEQQRIVERIEGLFAKLDEAKEKLQEVLDGFETRKAAILHKAFTGELTAKWREENGVSSEWSSCELKDIFDLQAGKNINASRISKQEDEKNLYPCFGGNGIRGYVECFNREGIHPIIGRQGALCGNVNLASGKFYATEHAVVVSFKQPTDIVWAEHYLRFLNFNQYATSTAQPGLAVSNIVKVEIRVPSFEEQVEIGKIIEDNFNKEKRVNLVVEETLNNIEYMKKAILARAFRGELGTNDENDESAVELLKRVL